MIDEGQLGRFNSVHPEGTDMTNWDDAYANGKYIQGSDTFVPLWTQKAREFRESLSDRAELDLEYGKRSRNIFDLFHPTGPSKGLFVFVHGGYWLNFDKSSWSHLAIGALAHGWTVAIPSYVLVPNAPIRSITRQIAKAVRVIGKRVDGPIRLAGHSAGGHLVARMNCEGVLRPKTLKRLIKTVSISGLHDLRPLRKTVMNEMFALSEDGAVAESPALQVPNPSANITTWVGSDERPEFIRQAQLLKTAWEGKVSQVSTYIEPMKHHFDIINGLEDPNSPLMHEIFS